jgi:DNA-binding IclR family transcriptional regulator
MTPTTKGARPSRKGSAKNAAAARVFSASVDRAARILMAVSGSPEPLALPSISRLAGMEKSTTFRILCTLVAEGLIAQDQISGAYSLGFLPQRFADTILGTLPICEVARPVLGQIRDRLNETSVLSVRDGWNRVNVESLGSHQAIVQTQRVGVPFPLHIGAPGLMILGALTAEEQERYFATEEFRLTAGATTATDAAFRSRLQDAMRQHYAVSVGECTAGGVLLAAPVYGADGAIAGAIHVAVPSGRWSSAMETESAEVVTTGARAISEAMQGTR